MPMTLRTLKKRSKQALPILRKHFPQSLGTVFLAERGENYHGLKIRCIHGAHRKSGNDFSRYRCGCLSHPLPGTPMTGEVSGYYEPEWDERTTYEALMQVLHLSDKPDTMTDAEWAVALRLIKSTPAKHADRLAAFEREMEEMSRDLDTADRSAG